MQKFIGTTFVLASLSAGFVLALPPAPANATDGQVTVRIDDPAMPGEYNQSISVTTQQELDFAQEVNEFQLLTKDACQPTPIDCLGDGQVISRFGFLPAYTILVMDIDG